MVKRNLWTLGLMSAAVTSAAFPASAGLFDGFRDREASRRDASAVRFAAVDSGELGPAISPSQYQAGQPADYPSLTVPPNEALTPIPETRSDPPGDPYGSPAAPAPAVPNYGPSYPPAYGGPGNPTYPGPGFMPGTGYAPGVPLDAYPAGPQYPMEFVEGMPLYPDVKIDDPENIPRHAVSKIVAVVDPRAPKNPCADCGPQTVLVKICVPPGECPRVKVEDHGRKVKYIYSHDFQVEIECKRGYIEVDYDD